MINIIVSSLVFASIAIFIAFILIRFTKLTGYNAMIYLFLFSSWFIMYLFKQNTTLNTHGVLTKWWVWAVVISLYQFTQAAMRVPLGILSQKLKSRNKIVILVMIIMVVGLIFVISSNFSAWAIIIAVIASGFVGATFGLDSQYWSENWNIKRGFISAALVFTIPVAARSLATVVNSSVDINNLDMYWISVVATIFGVVSIASFSFFKENTETIMLDNIDPNAKEFVIKKTMKDVFSLSISTAIIAGAYAFVSSFSLMYVNDGWILSIVKFVSLITSVLTAFFFIKAFNALNIKRIGLGLVVISTVALGVSLTAGYMGVALWVTLITISSIGFGMYIITMFGAALHFDHKFPALVLGIFLSVKSFAIGTGELTGATTHNSSYSLDNVIIGVLIISVILLAFISSELILHFSFRKDYKKNGGNLLILNAVDYEKNSSKIVISKNIVIK